MYRKLLSTALLFCVATLSVFAQNGVLTGNITSAETGESLVGVNIYIVELNQGTATDLDGNYRIENIPTGEYEIGVTYVGFRNISETISISSGENVLDFVMQTDVGLLDEIVVSGVADATPRKLLTVSVAKVDAERLNQVPATSVSSSLAAKVSGVTIRNSSGTPGGASNIQLRADNNLNVDSDPLVVVDGVIVEATLADINVDDIASIEVVKGAAASSLYGSRAGNGVVVVQTNRGALLENNEIEITLRNEVGFQQLERYIDVAEHHQYELASDWESASGTYTKYDGVTYPSGYQGGYHNEIINSRSISADHYMDNPFGVTNNIQEEFFQNGINSTNYISVGTRVDNLNVFGSFENSYQEGIIPDTDGYKRQNFRINADYQINDWMRLSTSNLMINTNSEFPAGGGGIFFNLVLAEPDNNLFLENPDGQPYYVRHNHWSNETNPLYSTYKIDRVEDTKRQLSSFSLTARPLDWLEYRGNFGFENEDYLFTRHDPYDTWTLGSGGPGPANNLGINYSEGLYYKYTENTYSQTLDHAVILRKSFGKLNWKTTVKYGWEKFEYEYFDAQGNDFAIQELPSLSAFPTSRISAESGVEEIQSQNVYGTLYLNYDDTYIFDGLIRRDESSLFGPDSRTNYYYRLSAAYRITEQFDIPVVDDLKFRVAQGSSGNRPEFAWQYETWSLSNGVANKNTLGNTELKPSTTTETEFAINATVGRVNLEAIYSKATTEDQFLRVPLLPVAGYNGQYQNAGTVEANTIELGADANIIQNNNFRWDMNLTWQTSKQEITELPVPAFTFGNQGLFYIREGEDYGAMYGRDWVRTLDQMAEQLQPGESIGDYEVNSDGYVIPAGTEGTVDEVPIHLRNENGDIANVKIGNGRPDWTAGIGNTVRYKGISLYLLLDIKKGGDVYNRKSQWLTRDFRNGIMDQSDVPDGQKKTIDYYIGFYDVNTNNSYWVEDAGYVKIRELAVSYNLGERQLEPLFGGVFKEVTASVIGRNLLTFTKYSGYDPEVGTIRQPYDGTGSYPNFRNLSFSLQLKF